MGLQQSKDKLVYQLVKDCNIDGIRSLHADGAGLEWMDNKGKTPLIVACMNPGLYNVAETLIELGANINAYRPGRHAGTPLHHAVKRGLDQTVELLLSHGANALVMNDDRQTPLELAKVKGYRSVARTIEAHICLFSGSLKELYESVRLRQGPRRFTRINTSREVWVLVVPCGPAEPWKPFKFELVIYRKYHPNRTAAVLCEANIEEPDFNQPEPVVVISDTTTVPATRLRFAALTENDEQLLRSFYNACKGIPQANPPAPVGQASAPPISEDDELAMAVQASLQSSTIQGPDLGPGPGPDPSSSTIHSSSSNPVASSSGTANNSKQDVPDTGIAGVPTAVEHIEHITCVICLDAPAEGACIPCGHLAGCMSCLNEIKAKNGVCPVCRANIKLVSRIYSV